MRRSVATATATFMCENLERGGESTRRKLLNSLALSPSLTLLPPNAFADGEAEGFITYQDAGRRFSCDVPASYVRGPRQDRTTTIFVAGDFRRAETISVQLLNASQLLLDAGIAASGDTATWPGIGTALGAARLLAASRDQDAAPQASGPGPRDSIIVEGSVRLDGDVLTFAFRTPLKVQRPDLLEKERGLRELWRSTLARAVMRGDGTLLALWAGAPEAGWEDGDGGGNDGGGGGSGVARDRLARAVESFRVSRVAAAQP
ncbi:unnamed protein product [Phaeothamnion confervicola]